jgi:hypothetical protein
MVAIVGRSFDHDLAVVDDHQAVTECIGLFEVVRRQEDRRAMVAKHPDVVPQVGSILWIESRARLVQEQDFGLVDDAEGDVEPPALSARIGLHPPVSELRDVEDLHQRLGAGGHRGEVAPVGAALKDEVLSPSGEIVCATELADVADARTNLLRMPGDVDPCNRRFTAVDGKQRRQHTERRRLAGAVRAEEAEDLPSAHFDTDTTDRLVSLLFPRFFRVTRRRWKPHRIVRPLMHLTPPLDAFERARRDLGRELAHIGKLGLAQRHAEFGLDPEQAGETLLLDQLTRGSHLGNFDLEKLGPGYS